jgi:hypothetical protein
MDALIEAHATELSKSRMSAASCGLNWFRPMTLDVELLKFARPSVSTRRPARR